MKFSSKKDILIILIGVIAFVSIFFGIDAILEETIPAKKHDKLISDIRKSAYKYGLDNIDYFKQGYEMYISVDSLITNGYLKGNDETKTLFIDNITNESFVGVVYIYYKDNKLHTDYLENYIDKDNLPEKNISIVLNNVSTNFIDISIVADGILVDNYDYYLDDLKVETSVSNNYIYDDLLYNTYKIKVVAHSDEQMYEDNIIVSLNQIAAPTFEFKNDVLSIIYPNNINDYVYEYSFDQINWIKTKNKVEEIKISSDINVSARVSDGSNQVVVKKSIVGFSKKIEEKITYQVSFDLNGGTGNIYSQKVESGKLVDKPTDPTKSGYKFKGWYLNGNEYNFNTPVSSNITLIAEYTNTENEIPVLKYNFASNTSGKWIFINNPEALYKEYLTDTTGKALYSDFINGNAEIYFEHYVKDDVSLKMKYGIRFYNPTSTSVTLKINKCGTAITRGDGNIYIETWKQYYGYSRCSIVGQSFTINSGKSMMIYLNVKSTGSGWNDWVCNYTTSLPVDGIPTSVIDGVLNVNSSGRLNVETFMFEDVNTIPSNSYSNSDNYIDTDANRFVYSGYYNKLPYLVANIKFNITDTTPIGALQIKYENNATTRDNWYTHLSATFNDKDVFTGDMINLINSNNPVYNWANYAVHYTENIILNNTTSSTKVIAYYVNSFYASNDSGVEKGSAIVAFSKDNNLNYSYKRDIIGKWHTSQNFEKIWEIKVPANTQITVPTEVLLGANSHGKLGRKVVLVS